MTDNDQSLPPTIEVGGDALEQLATLMAQARQHGSGTTVRLILRVIIEEGRRFIDTPEGRSITEQLAHSRLLKNGKVLWTMAGLDEFLAYDSPEDGASTLPLDEVVEMLRHTSIEDFLMVFLEEYAEQRYRNRNRADTEPHDT